MSTEPLRTRHRRHARLILALSLACLGALAMSAEAGAFNLLQPHFKWPGNPAKIKYFNAAKNQDPAIRDAVSIWNHSGIEVRFKRTSSPKEADLKITADKHFDCGNGLANTSLSSDDGRHYSPTGSTVWIGGAGGYPRCRYIDVLTAAHELGHVLGLDHEQRKCAVMNPVSASLGSGGGPYAAAPGECRGLRSGLWFCQVLTADDLKGAKKIYGGNPRVRRPEFCPTGANRVARAVERTPRRIAIEGTARPGR